MKLILLVAAFTIFATGSASDQSVTRNNALEQEIRKLDLAEADAIHRGDFAALNKLLAEDFTVNSPRNQIVNGREDYNQCPIALVRELDRFLHTKYNPCYHLDTSNSIENLDPDA